MSLEQKIYRLQEELTEQHRSKGEVQNMSYIDVKWVWHKSMYLQHTLCTLYMYMYFRILTNNSAYVVIFVPLLIFIVIITVPWFLSEGSVRLLHQVRIKKCTVNVLAVLLA